MDIIGFVTNNLKDIVLLTTMIPFLVVVGIIWARNRSQLKKSHVRTAGYEVTDTDWKKTRWRNK